MKEAELIYNVHGELVGMQEMHEMTVVEAKERYPEIFEKYKHPN